MYGIRTCICGGVMRIKILFFLSLLFVSCAHYKSYTAIDQNIQNGSVLKAVGRIDIPENIIQGKRVVVKLAGRIPPGNKDVVTYLVRKELMCAGAVIVESHERPQYEYKFDFEIFGETSKRFWLPFVVKHQKREFITGINLSVVDWKSREILFKAYSLGRRYFKEISFIELIGPFKKTGDVK